MLRGIGSDIFRISLFLVVLKGSFPSQKQPRAGTSPHEMVSTAFTASGRDITTRNGINGLNCVHEIVSTASGVLTASSQCVHFSIFLWWSLLLHDFSKLPFPQCQVCTDFSRSCFLSGFALFGAELNWGDMCHGRVSHSLWSLKRIYETVCTCC